MQITWPKNSVVLHPYLKKLATVYKANGVLEDVPAMEAYMRNQFKFYGLKSPLRESLTKTFVKNHGKLPYESMPLVVQEAFEQPYRELHYFAMGLLELHKKELLQADINLVAYMVTHRSWWDTVDYIATRGAGVLVERYPPLKSTMDQWSTHANFWLRRIAILHQMKYKKATNSDTLFKYCIANANDSEFFIQKAMGWALREYAYVDPASVKHFLKLHKMPKLTEREATKHL